MSDKLRKQIAVTREQLHLLLESFEALLGKVSKGKEPENIIEISALGGLLNSFYNGVENIFKRVAKLVDGATPRGAAWHVELLQAMTQPTTGRPAVISEEMRLRLEKYLDFRHFYVHGYTYELNWGLMAPLVLDCRKTLNALEVELDEFLRKMPAGN